MKKKILFFLILVLVSVFTCSIANAAETENITNSLETEVNYEYAPSEDFEFDEGVIIAYLGDDTHIAIPETIDGITVTRIGNYAFENFNSVESIILPSTITSIGNYAFKGCSNMVAIDIPDSVNAIGEYAFQNCSALKNIELPSNITQISEGLFRYCDSLLSISIPNGVTGIGYYAFQSCTSLWDISIPESVENIQMSAFEYTAYYNDSYNWDNNVLYIDNCLIKAKSNISGAYEIKNETRLIAMYAFSRCNSMTSAVIPDSVTHISYGAFQECTSLKTITIGENVEFIDSSAFESCTRLTKINWNATNPTIGTFSLFCQAGVDGEGVKVVFGDNVENIPAKLFEYCSASGHRLNIKSVTIGDNVKIIGSRAFLYCENLTTVVGGNNVESIGYGAFEYCKKLKSIDLGNHLQEISTYAFNGCESLTELEIPDSVTTVGYGAFSNCINLETLIIGNGVTTIDDCAVNNCKNLKNVTVGKKLKTLGYQMFYGCDTLTNIYWNAVECDNNYNNETFLCAGVAGEGINVFFGNEVKKIPAYLFYISEAQCKPKIKSIAFGDGVTTIGYGAFMGCAELTEVELPESVESIERGAFSGCTNLKTINLPVNLKTLGTDSFSECFKLTKINWDAKNANDMAGNTYFSNAGIDANGIEVVFGDSVEHIPAFALGNPYINTTPNITSIVIGSNVKSIGDKAFYYCKNLTHILWNAKNVEDFHSGSMIFNNAGKESSGIELIFGENVTNIPAYCFYLTSSYYGMRPNIIKTTLFENITTIGDYAFDSCYNLQEVKYGGNETGWNNIAIGKNNVPLTNASRSYFVNVTLINEDGAVISKKAYNINDHLDISDIENKYEHTIHLYTDETCQNEFDLTTSVTEPLTLQLRYVPNQYLAKFVDYDGKVVQEGLIDYGAVILLPENPARERTQQYTYTFTGWDGYTDGITQTNHEMVFTALYDATVNQYIYKFLDEDGKVLKEETVDYGTIISVPENPSKASTAQYSYPFKEWSGYVDSMTVEDDIVFTAVYSEIINKYTYQFVNDGNVIKSETVDYGTIVEIPDNPTKESTAQYTYTFAGWDGYTSGMAVEGDITFNATYTARVNQYTYKFVDDNGDVLKEETIDYGTTVVAPESPADKDAYTFDYWEGFSDGMTVSGDITFKAVYKYKMYNVSVFGYEDLKSEVIYNRNYTITPAEKYGYEFLGYYSEENGKGTKLTDENGNSLAVYSIEDNSVVYPYFKDLLCNKVVVSGADTVTIGDTDIRYTVSLGTDKEDIYYATIMVKYPKAFILKDVIKNKFDETEVVEITEYENYNIAEVLCVYSYDGNVIPTLTPIDAFEVCFNVDKTSKVHDVTVEITNGSILMGETEDYPFDTLVNASISIQPKLAESITIDGLSQIDTSTQYTATVYPDYTTDKTVIWSVSDETVATISEDGVLTPIKNGAVTITATANDGSEVFATKTVDVIAYAQITSISANGTWTEEFKNGKRNYTIYVGADVTTFDISARYSKGTLRVNGSTLLSGRSKSETLTDTETTITVERLNVDEMTNITYTLTVIKSSDALISESKTTENGYEFNIVLNKDNVESFENAKLVVALYDGSGKFIGLSPATVNGTDVKKVVPIETETPAYTAKVMLWNGLETLKPLCSETEITLK